MRLTARNIWMAAFVLGLSASASLPSIAEASSGNSVHAPLLSEPYEPGSSTVMNEWQFTPGEQTTIAVDSRPHVRHVGHCKNKKYKNSST